MCTSVHGLLTGTEPVIWGPGKYARHLTKSDSVRVSFPPCNSPAGGGFFTSLVLVAFVHKNSENMEVIALAFSSNHTKFGFLMPPCAGWLCLDLTGYFSGKAPLQVQGILVRVGGR